MIRDADRTWTGSLEEDHLRAIELLGRERDTLKEVLSSHLTPEQVADYLEVRRDQYLELLRQSPPRRKTKANPEVSSLTRTRSPAIAAAPRRGRLLYVLLANRYRTAGAPEVVWR